jgi:hypothetical protein
MRLFMTPINSCGIRKIADLRSTTSKIDNDITSYMNLNTFPRVETVQEECLAFEERSSKRSHHENSDNFESFDECLNFAVEQQVESNYSIKALLAGQPTIKRSKSEHLQPTVFIKLNSRASGKPKVITLKALLDTGASATILKMEHAKKLKVKVDHNTN